MLHGFGLLGRYFGAKFPFGMSLVHNTYHRIILRDGKKVSSFSRMSQFSSSSLPTLPIKLYMEENK